jgi:ABC-type branched-subunit amino acid transport system substrate-binding protein
MVTLSLTRRTAIALASASALALAASAAHAQSGPYKIGMSMDLTGPISFNGKIAAAGFETYVAKLNDTGGVNGRKVQLTVADDASDLAKGKANAEKFADDKSLAIFGFILSTVSAAVAPQAAKDKMPVIGLGGLAALLSPPQPYYFSYELQASKLADRILTYIAERSKADKIAKPRIAIMVVDVPSNREVAARAADLINKRGWTVAETQYFAISPTNVTAQAAAIKASNPDYVLMSHNDAGALVGVRGLRSAGITVPVINQWAGSADATLERLGEGYIAFRTFSSPTDDSVPAVAQVRADGQKYGFGAQMTNPYFTQGYVAGMILEKALKICGACANGEAFAKAMEAVGEVDAKGLAGPVKVSATSHEFIDSVRFYTWDGATNKAKPITGWIGPEPGGM